MQLAQIEQEIARIVPHQIHCATRKSEPGECNCDHRHIAQELNKLFLDVLKGRK